MKSSSHRPPLSHTLHCRCGTESLPCLRRFRFYHSCISTSDVLIKYFISSYTVNVPRISTTDIFALFFYFTVYFNAAASRRLISSYRTSSSTISIIPYIYGPPPCISTAAFDFTISLTHHYCNSVVIISIV